MTSRISDYHGDTFNYELLILDLRFLFALIFTFMVMHVYINGLVQDCSSSSGVIAVLR